MTNGTQYKRCRVQLHTERIVLRDIVAGRRSRRRNSKSAERGGVPGCRDRREGGRLRNRAEDLDDGHVRSHYFLFAIDGPQLDRGSRLLHQDTGISRTSHRQGSTNYAAIHPHMSRVYHSPSPASRTAADRGEGRRTGGEDRGGAGARTIALVEFAGAAISAATTELFKQIQDCPKVRIRELGEGGASPVQTGPFGAELHASEFVDEGIVRILNVEQMSDRMRLRPWSISTTVSAAIIDHIDAFIFDDRLCKDNFLTARISSIAPRWARPSLCRGEYGGWLNNHAHRTSA